MTFADRARKIKAVILDVDGVLTDGRLGYSGAGPALKFFNVRDGHAMKMALRHGLLVGILSGREDAATHTRAQELGLSFCYTGQKVKTEALTRLLAAHQLQPEQCAYVGDDVVDIPVLRRVGLAVCVADAAPEVVPHVHWQTTLGGGQGAVRELLFRLLQEQGRWDEAMARYLQD
jgi:3-deoxy-D-manno-octulosonate 8-phosphate phosphatase (KDO 8-P phosphatase)